MASIGAVECDQVNGASEELKEGVQTWRTPGYDGVGAQTVGKNVANFRFDALRFGEAADVRQWVKDVEALQGAIVTITDDRGIAHGNLLITRMSQPSETAVILVVGPGTDSDMDTIGRITVEGVRTN